jgi:hypothetical protein
MVVHGIQLVHCKKKVTGFPIPSWDVTYQTLPGRLPAGDGKTANLFLQFVFHDETLQDGVCMDKGTGSQKTTCSPHILQLNSAQLQIHCPHGEGVVKPIRSNFPIT